MTWIAIIMIYYHSSPAITTVPGFIAELECKVFIERVVKLNPTNLPLKAYCVPLGLT